MSLKLKFYKFLQSSRSSTSNKQEISRMTLNPLYLLKHDRNFLFTAPGSEPLILFTLSLTTFVTFTVSDKCLVFSYTVIHCDRKLKFESLWAKSVLTLTLKLLNISCNFAMKEASSLSNQFTTVQKTTKSPTSLTHNGTHTSTPKCNY
jgi:hypothetical protein